MQERSMKILEQVVLGLLMVGLGLFGISWGTVLWERIRNDSKVRLLSLFLTPTGARMFYVLGGAVLVVCGLLIAVGVMRK
jgi:hypothetical protein